MRYEIRVDHIARICIWRTRQHYGVMHQDLRLPPGIRQRIDNWIDRNSDLRTRDAECAHDEWLDYDEEGRLIARYLTAILGGQSQVFYFCEATDEFERIA